MAFSESRRKFLKLSLTGVAAAGALMFLRKATSLFDPISEEEYARERGKAEQVLRELVRG